MLNQVRSGQSHVTSQSAFFTLFRDLGGMLSRSLGMPSRNDGPPSICDTHGFSGNVFANPTASSSAPYPQGINLWNCSSRSSVAIVIQLKNNTKVASRNSAPLPCTVCSQLRSYSNHSQDTGCTIMDDCMTKASDLFPLRRKSRISTIQLYGLNAQRVRATNKRRASATREDKNADRTRNSQQQVTYT